jgi:hypothetical protein
LELSSTFAFWFKPRDSSQIKMAKFVPGRFCIREDKTYKLRHFSTYHTAFELIRDLRRSTSGISTSCIGKEVVEVRFTTSGFVLPQLMEYLHLEWLWSSNGL